MMVLNQGRVRALYCLVAFLIFGIFTSAPAFSADLSECMSLMSQGIRDKVTVIRKSDGKLMTRSDGCSHLSSSDSSGFEVEFEGIGVGYDAAGAYSNSLCHFDTSDKEFRSDYSYIRASIDSDLVRTIDDCIHVADGGLQVRSDLTDDDSLLIISIYYSPRPGETTTGVKLTGLQTFGNIKCSGSLKDIMTSKPGGASVGNSYLELACELATGRDEIHLSSSHEEIRGGTVVIATSAGTIMRWIPSHFPHNRNVEKELDDLKATLTDDFVMIKEGTAKDQGNNGWGYTVAFEKPFPDNYDVKTVLLNIDGFNRGSGNAVWRPTNVNNKGFDLSPSSGFVMDDWRYLALHYYAIGIKKKL